MKSFRPYLRALALIAAAAMPLRAQSHITVLAGYSSSRVVANPGGEKPITPVHGFVPGIGFTFPISNRVGLTTELLYVPKGESFADLNPDNSKPRTVYRLDVRYIELPFLVTARYPFGKAQLIVLGGTTVGARLRCAATITQADGSQSANNCFVVGYGTTVPTFNAAITAGFGFAWHRWTLTGQYEMTGSTLDPFPPGPDVQHRTLVLTLGFDLLNRKEQL